MSGTASSNLLQIEMPGYAPPPPCNTVIIWRDPPPIRDYVKCARPLTNKRSFLIEYLSYLLPTWRKVLTLPAPSVRQNRILIVSLDGEKGQFHLT